MGVFDILGNPISDDVSIKSYFNHEMQDTISKVRELQTEPNLTFFLITDIHAYYVDGAEELYKTSINNMRYLLKEIPCDGVINLGDSLEGYSTAEIAKQYGNQISNEFRKIGLPYFSVIGNHDENRYHTSSNAERFSVKQQYQVIVNPTRRIVSDETGLNYYVDFDEFKIRVIALNSVSSYTYEFSSETCDWFSQTALDTPTNYGVLILSHLSPFGAWNYNNTTPTNSATIQTALSAYSQNNDIISILCGHNHVDAVFSSPYVGATFNCEKFENENGNPSLWPSGAVKPQRTLGDYTEDCWNVVVIRPNSRKINFIRFGAGADYEITY